MSNEYLSSTSWEFVKILGRGSFGEVSQWTNVKTGESVAIKKSLKTLQKLGLDEQVKLKDRWEKERKWMSEINTENIVRACPDICAALVEEQNRSAFLPVIVTEFCDGGNLRSKLQKIENLNGLCENDVRQVLSALKNAIFYLHKKHDITHRDIKPDNIVIKHDMSGNPIYKLTDMGYAQIINTATVEASMVGSANYFAPEIVEFGKYKNNVDYWSMGVVAFEIICGVHPFLQNGSLYEVITAIHKMPSKCIAITKSSNGGLCYHTELFAENRLSLTFRRLMEQWLQLALQKDANKRGYEEAPESGRQDKQIIFYERLDATLDAKVLTVYRLNKCKLLSYFVDESTTLDSLYTSIEADTGKSRAHFYSFLPSSHSIKYLTPEVKPIQLYNKQFANKDRPMLYLVDIETPNALVEPDEPYIPSAVQLLFQSTDRLEANVVKHALFLHHNELRRVVEFVNGVNEYATSLENEIITEQNRLNRCYAPFVHYKGQVNQYEIMVTMGKQLLGNGMQVSNDLESLKNYLTIIEQMIADTQERLKKMLTKTREFITAPFANNQDNFTRGVKEFEKYIDKSNLHLISTETMQTSIIDLLNERKSFFQNTKKWLQLKNINTDFYNIIKILNDIQAMLNNSTQLEEKTKEYLQNFGKKFRRTEELSMDINMDYMDIPTPHLCEISNELIQRINTSLILAERNN